MSSEDYAMQLSMPQLFRRHSRNGLLLLALVFSGALVPQAHAALVAPFAPLAARLHRAADVAPRILLVDDDTNDPDVRIYYTAALNGLGLAYDTWDTTTTGKEPDAAALANYA